MVLQSAQDVARHFLVTDVYPRAYALMETLKKLIGSVSKQLLAVQSNWIPNPSLKQIARVGLRIDGLSNSLQRAIEIRKEIKNLTQM